MQIIIVQKMNPADPELAVCEIVQVSWLDRWQVYKRLQELEIPCWCGIDQPLRTQINTVKQAAQLMSVLRQVSASRTELVQWLECCWQIS
ncbi:Asr1405/Asl0597 family protein [Microcoleus sp. EPA2]|uniref:Asr1405/Asl0597 family protein n=1 Tax=Microcoleus sp. EPA2 TaxID=2841654 RepID=UPI00312B3D0E